MERHHRQPLRLRGYDYARAGAYFITICVDQRRCLFGEVIDAEMRRNEAGDAVQAVWEGLAVRFPSIELDSFVVMPNHVHGIVLLRDSAQGASPLPALSDVVRAFKSLSAIAVNRMHSTSGQPVWQRNYYEHVVRNETELSSVRQYIAENPIRWELDEDNPARRRFQTGRRGRDAPYRDAWEG